MTAEGEAVIRRLCAASAQAAPDRYAAARSLGLDDRDHETLQDLPSWDPIADTDAYRDVRASVDAPVGRLRTDAFYTVGVDLERLLARGLRHVSDQLPDDHPGRTYIEIELAEEAEHTALFEWFCGLPGGTDERLTTITPEEIERISRIAVSDPAVFLLYVLFGELFFDRVQRAALRAADSPEVVRAIDHLHRGDEARHISFGRTHLADLLATASSKTIRRMSYQAPVLARWTSDRVLGVPTQIYHRLGFDRDAIAQCTAAVRRSELHRDCARSAQRLCRTLGLDDPRLERSWRSTISGDADAVPV